MYGSSFNRETCWAQIVVEESIKYRMAITEFNARCLELVLIAVMVRWV
jgi:hypothetical protein